MKPRDLVEAIRETPQGRQWRQAIVLTVMPRLVIVEYPDGVRHCLPIEEVRPLLTSPKRY
jgi:hypothetical protein